MKNAIDLFKSAIKYKGGDYLEVYHLPKHGLMKPHFKRRLHNWSSTIKKVANRPLFFWFFENNSLYLQSKQQL